MTKLAVFALVATMAAVVTFSEFPSRGESYAQTYIGFTAATPTSSPATLQVSVVYPSNGMLVASQPQIVELSVTMVPPPQAAVQQASVQASAPIYRVRLIVSNAKGAFVKASRYQLSTQPTLAQIGTKSLQPGNYTLVVQLRSAGHTINSWGPFNFSKVKSDPSATPTPTVAATPTITPTATPTNTPTATPTAISGAVWTLAPTSVGFQWVSPSGTNVCKYAGASEVDLSLPEHSGQFTNIVPSKYSTNAVWAQAQNNRLKSWGFNAAGQYSYSYQSNNPVGGVGFEVVAQVSGHAARDDEPYHCKNLNHNYGAMVCAPGYLPSAGGQIDPFDVSCDSNKGVAQAYIDDVTCTGAGASAHVCSNPYSSSQGIINSYNIMLNITEEGDDLFGMNNILHEDITADIMDVNPMQKTSVGGFSYPNATVDAKIALRDYLASEYGCSNPAGGIGTPISGGDDLYSNAGYCGFSAASSALSALNSAWHTSYTTWGTSDANGETGIKNGTYTSYGTGTGFLDEKGNHIIASAYQSNCGQNGGLLPGNAWTAYPQIESDLHAYAQYFAQTYGQKMRAAWSQISKHAPVFVPIYTGPSYIYTGVSPYFDGLWISPGYLTGSLSISDLQRIIKAASVSGGKSMPIIVADYSSADADSPWGADAPSDGLDFPTQETRASAMVSFWQNALPQKDVNGKFVVVGLEHWAFYDQSNEGYNAGFVTTDHDNPYNGSADTANGEKANYGDVLTPISDFLNAGICDP